MVLFFIKIHTFAWILFTFYIKWWDAKVCMVQKKTVCTYVGCTFLANAAKCCLFTSVPFVAFQACTSC